jgi:hypothetical protein
MSEKANLQSLMTSQNYLFIFTRSALEGLSSSFQRAPFMTSLGLVFGVPFFLAVDGVGFIFELAMTLDDMYNGV